jgi:hypothetical protein
VSANFPSVRVVTVPGQDHFSNWRARNAGAATAQSDVLIFIDADTILADGAVEWIDHHLEPRTYGFFNSESSRAFNKGGPRVAANQLRGFQVIPRPAFRRASGYDQVLEGYAAGADTDLEFRLARMGIAKFVLDPQIVEDVVQHDAASRTSNHAVPIKTSYAAGLLYRAAKRTLLRMNRQAELPLAMRRNLYRAASAAARRLTPGRDRVTMTVRIGQEPVLMPRQLGYQKGDQTISLQIEVALQDPLVPRVQG